MNSDTGQVMYTLGCYGNHHHYHEHQCRGSGMEIITPVPNKWFIYRNESLPPKLTESGII